MEVGLIRKIDIDSEMQQAYLDYAMSVIVARALPDARDGLKPVHRRILYAMHDMGLRPDSGYKKSARIVGEVLGKYHPHGDMAVYEAMARMAQDFSMRYLLVDGQGNFGSVDGDAPAAMRYTEARLGAMAADMLKDIDKDTVDFVSNFDDTLTEPAVLPSAVPNLLVNGGSGIAVGMATSVPPHNLGEVIDALVYMIDHWGKLDDVTVDTLMRFIHGPDFPTGGIIIKDPSEEEGLSAAYGTGRGKITVQARAHVEDMGRGRSRIIVTELPYQTNKASLIERIADLVRDGTIDGIADLRDESDRQGMRIVIELSKTAEPDRVLKDLYRRTPMQGTFSIIMLALVNGEPRLLSLKQSLRVFLDHRQEVVRRRSEFELARAKERAHILEGVLVALKHLDEVIKIIRNSKDPDEAKGRLTKRFNLSEVQAVAILDMPLKRLASLERQKIEVEYKEKKELIKHLEGLLGSPKRIREVIAEELKGLKSAYGDRRRTRVISAKDAKEAQALLTAADTVASENVWVTLTRDGLISRTPAKKQPKPGEAPVATVGANTRDLLYLFTAKGRGACVPVHSLPEKEDPAEGAPFASVSAYDSNAQVTAAVAVSSARAAPAAGEDGQAGDCVFLATEKGMVKKIALPDLPGPSSQVFNVMNVAEGDRLGWARRSTGSDEILLVTALGQAIRFKESEVRSMGLAAQGVMGIKISRHDEKVVGMDVVKPRAEVVIMADNGQGKRSPLSQFPTQGRYGVGVAAWKVSGKSRLVGAAIGYADDRVTLITAKSGAKVVKLDAFPRRGRPARGGAVLKLKPGDGVVSIVPALAQPEPPAAKPPVPAKKPAKPKAATKKAAARSNGKVKAKRK